MMKEPVTRSDKAKGGLIGKASSYIGGLSLIFAGAGLLALILSGLIKLLFPNLATSAQILLAVGLLSLLVAFASSFSTVKATVLGRRGRYGVNTILMVVVFLGIVIVINYIGDRNAGRIDMTGNKTFTLAPQSAKVLHDLKTKVEAVGFFTPNDARQAAVRGPATDLLQEYAHTTGNFTYRFVDPELDPGTARQYGVNSDSSPGEIVFSSEGRLQPVETLKLNATQGFTPNINLEKDYTQAILAVTHQQQKKVYFLVRHGEPDITDAQNQAGYGLARLGLEGDNYQVDVLDLASAGKVPDDCAVLVVAGPKRDLLDEEKQPIEDYLRNYGRALFLLDPNTPQSYRDLIKRWAVDIGTGEVADAGSFVSGDLRSPIVQKSQYSPYAQGTGLAPSPITNALNEVVFFQEASALEPTVDMKKLPQTLLILPILESSPISWLETDPNATSPSANEQRGPLSLGMTIDALAPLGENPPTDAPQGKRTQMVILGDSDFASNRFFTSFSNGDLFLNSVNWLADDVDLISVRPKLTIPRELVVTNRTWAFIKWSSLLILPVVVGAAGAATWWRKR